MMAPSTRRLTLRSAVVSSSAGKAATSWRKSRAWASWSRRLVTARTLAGRTRRTSCADYRPWAAKNDRSAIVGPLHKAASSNCGQEAASGGQVIGLPETENNGWTWFHRDKSKWPHYSRRVADFDLSQDTGTVDL
jgi:hypothetical protein